MADVVIIENGRHERNYWGDIWRYRELFYVLACDSFIYYRLRIVRSRASDPLPARVSA